MKKVLLFVALMTVGFTVNAQTKFGVKAGAQLTNLTGSDDLDTKSKFGFYVGGFANISLTEQFAFQPELLISSQGAKQEFSESETIGGVSYSSKVDVKYNLMYLQIPLMMKWYAYDRFNLEFGPQIGLNLSAKMKGDISESMAGIEYSESFDEKMEDVESMDFSLNIGAGYEMENGLSFGVRYGLGLTEIQKETDAKNSVISFGVGYSF